VSLHLPRPRSRPLPGGLHAPLVLDERNLSFEEAAKAGWEELYERFVVTWIAYKWFLDCGYITGTGHRSDHAGEASTARVPDGQGGLDALEAVRTDPASTYHRMVRHAFRVALRTQACADFAEVCADVGRLADPGR